MMGVYIKGMEMPKSCAWCRFLQSTDPIPKRELFCGIDTTNNIHDYKPDKECPLVPVPPHGDLIDRDALRESFRESIKECHKWADEMRESGDEDMLIRAEQSLGTFVECSLRVKNAPTIIPAEEAKDTNVPTYDLLYEEGGYNANGV